MNTDDEINRLDAMLRSGALSDEEFDAEVAIVLGEIPPAASSGLTTSADRLPPPRTAPQSWEQFEELAAIHMRALGFFDAEVTGPGTDGGIDVIATGAVAQVKAHATATSRPDVQQLKGAAAEHLGSALFYSLSGYTAGAIEWADNVGVALFVLESNGTARPVSGEALALMKFSPPGRRGWQPLAGWGTIRDYVVVRNDGGGIDVVCRFIPDDGGKHLPLIFRSVAPGDTALTRLGEYVRGVFSGRELDVKISRRLAAENESLVDTLNALEPARRAFMSTMDTDAYRMSGHGWDAQYRLVPMAPGLLYKTAKTELPRP